MKVANWEETEEQVTEEIGPFLVTTFLSHGEREKDAPRQAGSSILPVPAPWLGLVGFEKFEVELTKHATGTRQ